MNNFLGFCLLISFLISSMLLSSVMGLVDDAERSTVHLTFHHASNLYDHYANAPLLQLQNIQASSKYRIKGTIYPPNQPELYEGYGEEYLGEYPRPPRCTFYSSPDANEPTFVQPLPPEVIHFEYNPDRSVTQFVIDLEEYAMEGNISRPKLMCTFLTPFTHAYSVQLLEQNASGIYSQVDLIEGLLEQRKYDHYGAIVRGDDGVRRLDLVLYKYDYFTDNVILTFLMASSQDNEESIMFRQGPILGPNQGEMTITSIASQDIQLDERDYDPTMFKPLIFHLEYIRSATKRIHLTFEIPEHQRFTLTWPWLHMLPPTTKMESTRWPVAPRKPANYSPMAIYQLDIPDLAVDVPLIQLTGAQVAGLGTLGSDNQSGTTNTLVYTFEVKRLAPGVSILRGTNPVSDLSRVYPYMCEIPEEAGTVDVPDLSPQATFHGVEFKITNPHQSDVISTTIVCYIIGNAMLLRDLDLQAQRTNILDWTLTSMSSIRPIGPNPLASTISWPSGGVRYNSQTFYQHWASNPGQAQMNVVNRLVLRGYTMMLNNRAMVFTFMTHNGATIDLEQPPRVSWKEIKRANGNPSAPYLPIAAEDVKVVESRDEWTFKQYSYNSDTGTSVYLLIKPDDGRVPQTVIDFNVQYVSRVKLSGPIVHRNGTTTRLAPYTIDHTGRSVNLGLSSLNSYSFERDNAYFVHKPSFLDYDYHYGLKQKFWHVSFLGGSLATPLCSIPLRQPSFIALNQETRDTYKTSPLSKDSNTYNPDEYNTMVYQLDYTSAQKFDFEIQKLGDVVRAAQDPNSIFNSPDLSFDYTQPGAKFTFSLTAATPNYVFIDGFQWRGAGNPFTEVNARHVEVRFTTPITLMKVRELWTISLRIAPPAISVSSPYQPFDHVGIVVQFDQKDFYVKVENAILDTNHFYIYPSTYPTTLFVQPPGNNILPPPKIAVEIIAKPTPTTLRNINIPTGDKDTNMKSSISPDQQHYSTLIQPQSHLPLNERPVLISNQSTLQSRITQLEGFLEGEVNLQVCHYPVIQDRASKTAFCHSSIQVDLTRKSTKPTAIVDIPISPQYPSEYSFVRVTYKALRSVERSSEQRMLSYSIDSSLFVILPSCYSPPSEPNQIGILGGWKTLCQNNGQCQNDNRCACKDQFVREYCQSVIPVQCSAPKSNFCTSPFNGDVVYSNDNCPISCQCKESWSGLKCQSCDLQCFNGGSADTTSCAQCLCDTGSSGEQCQCRGMVLWLHSNLFNDVITEYWDRFHNGGEDIVDAFSILNDIDNDTSLSLSSQSTVTTSNTVDPLTFIPSSIKNLYKLILETVQEEMAAIMNLQPNSLRLKFLMRYKSDNGVYPTTSIPKPRNQYTSPNGWKKTDPIGISFEVVVSYECSDYNPLLDRTELKSILEKLSAKLPNIPSYSNYFSTREGEDPIIEATDPMESPREFANRAMSPFNIVIVGLIVGIITLLV